MTSLRSLWKRIVFELRGRTCLNDTVDEIGARGFHLLLTCALLGILLLRLDEFYALHPRKGAL